MGVEYFAAPAAARVGDQVIRQHHPHLADVRVEFVFRSKAAKSNGRIKLGTARKVTGLQAFMARHVTSDVVDDEGDEFFLIELAKDEWDRLSPRQQRALVDHELCHCRTEIDEDSGELKLVMRGHDVEEFTDIVRRYGTWKDDLQEFAEAIKEQTSLFEEVA